MKKKTTMGTYIIVAIMVYLFFGLAVACLPKLYSFYVKTLKPYQKEKDVFGVIEYRDIEFLKELIEQGCDVKSKSKYGETTITSAIYAEYSGAVREHTFTSEELEKIHGEIYDIIKVLIENGADVNERNEQGLPPLFLSANSDMYRVTENLLEYGAHTDVFIEYSF